MLRWLGAHWASSRYSFFPVRSLACLTLRIPHLNQVVHYCCRECQVEDWKQGHKAVCGEVVRLCAGALPS